MREVPRGLVENKARQALARALMHRGPLTAPELTGHTGLSVACSRYHLRALASVGAVRPSLKGLSAKGDEVAWALALEQLPEQAREALLGEVVLRTCFRLAHIMFFEGCRDVAELADRVGLSEQEVARHIKALGMEGQAEGMRRFNTGNRPDRLSDYDPRWVDRWLGEPSEGDDDADSREDGAE